MGEDHGLVHVLHRRTRNAKDSHSSFTSRRSERKDGAFSWRITGRGGERSSSDQGRRGSTARGDRRFREDRTEDGSVDERTTEEEACLGQSCPHVLLRLDIPWRILPGGLRVEEDSHDERTHTSNPHPIFQDSSSLSATFLFEATTVSRSLLHRTLLLSSFRIVHFSISLRWARQDPSTRPSRVRPDDPRHLASLDVRPFADSPPHLPSFVRHTRDTSTEMEASSNCAFSLPLNRRDRARGQAG